VLLLLPCLVSRLSDTDDALVADVKARYNDLKEDGWNISTTPENLAATFPDIDLRVRKLFLNAEDIKMWRLYMHEPYPYWVKGRCALLGDAAHPMMPDQSQGACMAIEDVCSTF
jgi:salicylate hydroxylase